MSILPTGGSLDKTAEFSDWASKTWKTDPGSGRLVGFCDGLEAVRQTVEIILSVERFHWQIYTHNFGAELSGIVGNDFEYANSEIRRRVEQALSVDSRITGVSDFEFVQNGETLTCSFVVGTVFGSIVGEVHV